MKPSASDFKERRARVRDEIADMLFRPIALLEPQRVVHPPSWLEHIPFAFWIVEALQPATFVELGTHSGNSYAAFAQAVQSLGLPTACYAVDTWRGDAQAGHYEEDVFVEWRQYHDQRYSGFSRLIRATFDEAAESFSDGSIDLLHLDGLHTYDAVLQDFTRWRPKMSGRGIMLLHDVNVREGDFGAWRVWEELRGQYRSFEFLHSHGLGVLAIGHDFPPRLEWLLSQLSRRRETALIRRFFARLGRLISAEFAARSAGERAGLDVQTAPTGSLVTPNSSFAAQLKQAESERDASQAAAVRAETEAGRIAEELTAGLAAERERRAFVEQENHALKATRSAGAFPSHRDLGKDLKQHLHAIRHTPARVLRSMARTLRGLTHRSTGSTRRGLITFARHPRLWLNAYAATASGLFDARYYSGRYADVSSSSMAPLMHFVLTGSREGRDPHPLFDAAGYLEANSDVAGGEPLFHYLRHGAREGRHPHPLFDVSFYLDQNPDVRAMAIDPLSHFLRWGAAEGRNPNQHFDSAYYLRQHGDVALGEFNPLIHYVSDGWREGRRTSATFDTAYYVSHYDDVVASNVNPLVHYLRSGLQEGRRAVDEAEDGTVTGAVEPPTPFVRFRIQSGAAVNPRCPTIMCLSHVMPWPPRAGNEYRIFRMLRWFREQGYRIVLVVAPLPGDTIEAASIEHLRGLFENVVVCDRDGRLDYRLTNVPDVLATLEGDFSRPIGALLDEDAPMNARDRQLLGIDRTFCHDALVTTVLRLHSVLGAYVLLAEYIWMSRVLPLLGGDVLKVIDTIDVFSTKRDKVLQFGIDDWHLEPEEEARRLRKADIVVAIQEEERAKLAQLVPGGRVVTAGVDFDPIAKAGEPAGRGVLYVASDNPMNRRGLSDFLKFAWPRIRLEVPDAELLVVGKVNPPGIGEAPGVRRMGVVADLRPLYDAARVVINPAVAGTGLKIKTLEAICHFRPVVTWPNGVDGLAAELAALCTTVRDWYEFAHALVDLLRSAEPRTFSPQERDRIVRLTSPDVVYGGLGSAIKSGAASHP